MSSTAPLCSPPLRGSEFDDLTHLADADALERLAVVRAQLEAWQEPGVLAALAQGMPARVATLAPEVALALQEIAHGLAPHGLVVPEDVWLPHALPPRLRVAWLRTALVARPSEISRLVDEPTLLAVAYGWQLEGLPGAQPVLAH
ncbi:MAG TPA: hypothetical protein PKU97_22810, partial [Kofleriaceae bacterium]|nr:hypothetical protein [Kofleriaceae bacterium]